jgi:hypothetical protein
MNLLTDVTTLLKSPLMNAEDVRTLLRDDHDELRKLAEAMCDAGGAEKRRALLKQLRPALVAHSRAEEHAVYRPLLGRKDSKDSRAMAEEGFVEHELLDALLDKLSRSRKIDSEEWHAVAGVLKEILDHHIDEEHDELFDELGEHFSDDQRKAMGTRFLAAKQKAIASLAGRR